MNFDFQEQLDYDSNYTKISIVANIFLPKQISLDDENVMMISQTNKNLPIIYEKNHKYELDNMITLPHSVK